MFTNLAIVWGPHFVTGISGQNMLAFRSPCSRLAPSHRPVRAFHRVSARAFLGFTVMWQVIYQL